MKKILCILCAMAAFVSCSKEEIPTTESGQNADGSYTFNIGIEEPDYVPKSRAEVTMGRYMLEMYEGDLTATPVKMTNTTGVFNVELTKNTDYVCLFWADNGINYDATSLKAVKQTTETAPGTAAYAAKVTVNSKTFNGAITLKRAVAELSFIDKNGLNEPDNKLMITYPYASATLNVGDGTVTHTTGTAVRTIEKIAPPVTATTAFATDYILAPTVAGKLAGLKFQFNTEAEKIIAEIAIQANYKTKITGEYQPKPEPKIGSFYYSDGSFSTALNGAKTCIGIVYWLGNPTINDKTLREEHSGCTHGLVVALEDEIEMNWQSKCETYGITVNEWILANTSYATINSYGNKPADQLNQIWGYNNTKAIEAFNAAPANSTWPVEAVQKIVDYRTKVPTPAGNSGWFLPSMKELTLLFGTKKVTNIWTESFGMDNYFMINEQLKKVSGATTKAFTGRYWSSTETKFNGVVSNFNVGYVFFTDTDSPYATAEVSHKAKYKYRVRAVCAF